MGLPLKGNLKPKSFLIRKRNSEEGRPRYFSHMPSGFQTVDGSHSGSGFQGICGSHF